MIAAIQNICKWEAILRYGDSDINICLRNHLLYSAAFSNPGKNWSWARLMNDIGIYAYICTYIYIKIKPGEKK